MVFIITLRTHKNCSMIDWLILHSFIQFRQPYVNVHYNILVSKVQKLAVRPFSNNYFIFVFYIKIITACQQPASTRMKQRSLEGLKLLECMLFLHQIWVFNEWIMARASFYCNNKNCWPRWIGIITYYFQNVVLLIYFVRQQYFVVATLKTRMLTIT